MLRGRTFASTRSLTSTLVRDSPLFSRERVCSPANRQRCVEQLLRMRPIRIGTAAPPERQAAVLIPLCEDPHNGGALSLLFTLRSAALGSHSRQVSFPGGMRDASDASFEACALRETREEIGLASDRIDVWTEAPSIQPHNGPKIVPVVGFVRDYDPAALRLNRTEVDAAFAVPLQMLCAPDSRRHTQFRGARGGYSVPTFVGGAHRVWGITAVMTHVLLLALMPREAYARRTIPFVANAAK